MQTGRPLQPVLRYLRRVRPAPPRPGVSDAELLRRFATSRDEAAFELLVWRHGPMVLRVCRGILGDAHAAEDAYQAAFLALAKKAGSIAVLFATEFCTFLCGPSSLPSRSANEFAAL